MKLIQEFYNNLQTANREQARKELFMGLLGNLFRKDEDATRMLQAMNLGAEKTILNIPLAKRRPEDRDSKTGFADTQYGRVIIEFEADMRKTGAHAKDQLKEYFSGNWKMGNQELFTLIATDCERWEVYGVNPDSILEKAEIRPEAIELRLVERFDLKPDVETAMRFFYFLDRHLFRTERLSPTIESVQLDFGSSSALFLNLFSALRLLYAEAGNEPQLQTAYAQWNTCLSMAYGKFQGSPDFFLTHTYLSLLSKLMAYAVLKESQTISEEELEGLVRGSAFTDLNVTNFAENDFFRWVAEPRFFARLLPDLRKVAFRVSDYDYAKVSSDVLKGVYQEMVDLETRHTLGEYYTPDWLCAEVMAHAAPAPGQRLLDPSCGSGSFLLAAISYLRTNYPELSAEDIAQQVVGIDIHPLSVQVAKTTYLIALGNLLEPLRRPLHIPVYLANALITPEGVSLFRDTITLEVAGKEYNMPLSLFADNAAFDTCVAVADHLAETTQWAPAKNQKTLENALAREGVKFTNGHSGEIYKLYMGLREAKEKGRDSIWKFVLQNSYKPFFLKQQFDWVIGNPPWVTFADIPNGTYQDKLKALARQYGQLPAKKANMPHLEIAAIFLSHAGSYFLQQQTGRVAFVVPRSFLTAEHHNESRTGLAKGFKLAEVWDLEDVDNLFNVPSCVLWAAQAHVLKEVPKEGLPGRVYKGRPPRHNASQEEIKGRVSHAEARFYLNRLNKNTALATSQQTAEGKNAYHANFRQGATLVPRNFYFIRLQGPTPSDWNDRLLGAETVVLPEAKAPWKDIELKAKLNTNYFFRTALAKNLAPFALLHPMLVFLPIRADEEGKVWLLSEDEILELGDLDVSAWMRKVETEWTKHKTENNKDVTAIRYLNWQNKLTDQNLSKPFVVLYSASAKDANACVLERATLDLPFIADHKSYIFNTYDICEANYLSAFLNSNFANLAIKSFQSRGLFGPRDVHKKILDVPLPEFDPANKTHQGLAELGRVCAEKAANLAPKTEDYNIGQVRAAIRGALAPELAQIDALLAALG